MERAATSGGAVTEGDDYDVIVIGAGIAGLVAAAKMQRGGLHVALFEQHEIVGGYCTNWKRRGYEFDTAIHCIAGCEEGGGLHRILTECGAADDVEFIRLEPYLYKAKFPDQELMVPSDLEAFIALLAKHFPHERGVRPYFEGLERIYDFVETIGDKDLSPARKILTPLLKPRSAFDFGRHLSSPYGAYLASHIKDPRVRQILSQLWGFFGAPPSRLSLHVFTMGFMSYYKQGAYYIRGGSQKLSDAFSGAFRRHGGALSVMADVERIEVTGGRATGIVVAHKDARGQTVKRVRHRAKRILSCADATHTLRELVGEEHLDGPYRAALDAMVPATSAFVIYLGVDMDLPESVKDDFDIFVNGSVDPEAAFEQMVRGEVFDDFALTIYTKLEPSFSPAPGKKHVITLLSIMNLDESTMGERWKVDDVQRRGREYLRIKQDLANRLLDRAETIIPGLREHAEVLSIATPVTMKRYTRNRNGSLMGWENSCDQSMMRRMNHKTPVENLWLASSWTFPGGGVNGAALGGSGAAERLLKDLRR